MSIGKVFRKIAGKRLFYFAADKYRSFFVNLNNVCNTFPAFPDNSQILDIGGGDGFLTDIILSKFEKVNITMIDISGNAGYYIRGNYRDRVKIIPNMDITNFVRSDRTQHAYDYVIISDVIHHIPEHKRSDFFKSIERLFSQNAHMHLIIKDIEPGYFKSYLSLLADRYISGDRLVKLISKKELISKMKSLVPGVMYFETDLFLVDRPNYSLVFSR